MIARAARSPLARPVRALVNAVVGDEMRVVRVLTGAARGARLELDLSQEKAYWLGHYERDLQELLRERLRRGDVFWDVGAHIGFFAVCACSLGARVVALEPAPENARRVRRNAELNGFDVQVVEAAAWSDAGGVELLPGASASEWRVRAGGSTPTVALDDVDAPRPALVKLDVEGAAGLALAGAARTLVEAKPIVVCEVHDAEEEAGVRAALAAYTVKHAGSPARLVAFPRSRGE